MCVRKYVLSMIRYIAMQLESLEISIIQSDISKNFDDFHYYSSMLNNINYLFIKNTCLSDVMPDTRLNAKFHCSKLWTKVSNKKT